MKKWLLIFIVMLVSLYNVGAALPDVSLSASAYGNDVILSWSYQLECANQCINEGERQCLNYGYQECGDFNGDGCLEWGDVISCSSGEACSNGECAMTTESSKGSYGTESDLSLIGEVQENGAYGSYGTGQTIRLFTGKTILDNIKNIFANIIKTLKNLFGLSDVGLTLNYEFEVYRNNNLIASGRNNDFNCQENICTYEDKDLDNGNYIYDVKIKNLAETDSKNSNSITVIINIELPTSYGVTEGGEIAYGEIQQETEESTAYGSYGANETTSGINTSISNDLTNITNNMSTAYGSYGVETIVERNASNNQTVQISSSETSSASGGGGGGGGGSSSRRGQGSVDNDKDSLPDDWELAYFPNLNQDSADDYDGDTLDNLEEYENGTNPKVPNSDKSSLLFGVVLVLVLIAIIGTPVFIIIKRNKNKKRAQIEAQFNKPAHKTIYDYIEKARKNKFPKDNIRNSLISAGWSKEDIDYVMGIK